MSTSPAKIDPLMNPSALPSEWQLSQIGEMTEPVEKVNPKQQPDTLIKYIDISGINNQSLSIVATKEYKGKDAPSRARQLVQGGDVLFSTVRTYLKNIAVVPESLSGEIASTGFSVLRAKNAAYQKYLFYFVQFEPFLNELAKFQRGTSYPAVRDGDVRAQLIPLPPPQRALEIVDEIEKQFSRLDEAVANLHRAKANLKRYKAAVLKAAVEGRLVETEAELARREGRTYETGEQLLQRILKTRRGQWKGKGKYKEPAVPDTTDLPDLPEGWAWATLPQLGELERGKSKHRPRNDEGLFGGPYPFIQTGEVRQSAGLISEHTQTYSEFGLAQSRLWPSGTLCITIAANIAESGILAFDACFPDSVVGFIPALELVTARYLEFFVRTAKEDLERFAPATAQKNINLQVLRSVAIALPPLEEQRRIVAETDRQVSIIEDCIIQANANLSRADRLRQSVLASAFLCR